jgi:hypothetical protein
MELFKTGGYIRQALLWVLAGTSIRLAYGLYYQVWNLGHDQNAWAMSLGLLRDHSNWSYRQLIHYPFEGGTVLLSLLSFLFPRSCCGMPALSMSMLLADSIVRFFQILIAQRLFGQRAAAWFGAWTVFGLPMFLPMGSTYFGLHSISSVFPFVFLYAFFRSNLPSRAYACAIVIALSLMFSYNNVVLIPVYFFAVIREKSGWRKTAAGIISFIIVLMLMLLPHLFVRLFVDHGFGLQPAEILVSRKQAWGDMTLGQGLINLVIFYSQTLPGSFFLASADLLRPWLQCTLALFFIASGVFLAITRKPVLPAALLAAVLIFTFSFFYCFSIFFVDRFDHTSFHYYRHLSYIIPLLILLLFHGFGSIAKRGIALCVSWLAICTLVSIHYAFTSEVSGPPSYRVIGWIQAGKYGNEPQTLSNLYNTAPENQKNELAFGYGWGLTACILRNKPATDTVQINRLLKTLSRFPPHLSGMMKNGVFFAFNPGITPVLDTAFRNTLRDKLPDK